jgi:hypothetical protein
MRLTAKETDELNKLRTLFHLVSIDLKTIEKIRIGEGNGHRYIIENIEEGVYIAIDIMPQYAVLSYVLLPSLSKKFLTALINNVLGIVHVLRKKANVIFATNVPRQVQNVLKDVGFSLDDDDDSFYRGL